jgi:hypothetical protein
MNPLAILLQSVVPSSPFLVIGLPITLFLIHRAKSEIPFHMKLFALYSLCTPVIMACIGSIFFDTRILYMEYLLYVFLLLQFAFQAYEVLMAKDKRLLVVSFGLPLIVFSAFTLLISSMSLWNSWI